MERFKKGDIVMTNDLRKAEVRQVVTDESGTRYELRYVEDGGTGWWPDKNIAEWIEPDKRPPVPSEQAPSPASNMSGQG